MRSASLIIFYLNPSIKISFPYLVFILFIYILGAYCGIRLRVDMGGCGWLPHSYLGAGRRYLVRAERSPPADRGQQTVRERQPRVCVDGVRARRVGSAAE